MTTQSASLRLADQLRLTRADGSHAVRRYSSVGCYPLFAVTSDGAALCPQCVNDERLSIGTTTGTDGWRLVAIDANWENPDLYCDHCGDRIESAYAEPE
jgi:hypothetical protein